jgi:beta-glucosidase
MTPKNTPTMQELVKQLSTLVMTQDGTPYRDLNKNGKMDIYEDATQPIDARVEDLLSQMTLQEKAGTMFIHGSIIRDDGSIEADPAKDEHQLLAKQQMEKHWMSHFNLWAAPDVNTIAAWVNRLQKFAETTRLGIPVTIASDPRNHFSNNIYDFAGHSGDDFSLWCNCLGFGALDDVALMKQFADAVRKEYLAVGIRVALHPQIDLATEPRWPRISGTFGEDAHISGRMGKAYIEGFQTETLGPDSVACMPKHFPGGGPQKEGLDPHFEFQQGQIYPGNNFDYHLIPFEMAFEARPAAIMPYYGVPTDQTDENVAMSYNKAIITGLAREKYGYDGVICTDWGLVTDAHIGADVIWPARAWGVEELSQLDRVKKIIDAGVDQFGGENCSALVVELVQKGLISEERINESVRRLLSMKFQLGLFDNPFVDESALPEVFGNKDVIAASEVSQKRAMTLLKNDSVLPLKGTPKLYVKNINPEIARQYGVIVENPEEADFAILHEETPWVPVDTENPFARGFHHGDLDFKGDKKEEILAVAKAVPTILVMHMDRPAVIPEINEAVAGLFAEFGASDASILDVIFGKAKPEGKLPFELPSSMEAVYKQRTDMPHDSENPLYSFGFGLRY